MLRGVAEKDKVIEEGSGGEEVQVAGASEDLKMSVGESGAKESKVG
jgi:hypothetical protein